VVHDVQDHQTCYEACRTASSSLRDMQQALQAVRMAARCLYLRLLLSDAAKTEFAAHAPAVAGFFSGDHEQSLAVPAWGVQHAKRSTAASLCCPPNGSSNEANLQTCMLWTPTANLQTCMMWTPIANMHAHLCHKNLGYHNSHSLPCYLCFRNVSAGAKQPDAEYLGPDVADLFDLPRCNSNATSGLSSIQATVDPALVQLIEGTMSCLTQNNHSHHPSTLV